MTIDRADWASTFRTLPRWTCPTCRNGRLGAKDNALSVQETGPSEAAHDLHEWEPEWITKRFAGLLTCDNPGCAELVAICGTIEVTDVSSEWEQQFGDTYTVVTVHPSPIPIRVPEEVPSKIVAALEAASATIWMDADASANKIRQAVECMMDDLGVRKTTLNRQRKRVRLNLHSRIVAYRRTNANVADFLLAIKWLGNIGSHGGSSLARSDILDGFELIELALEEIYGTTKQRLLRKAKEIIKAKGPAKPKRWRLARTSTRPA